MALQYWLIVDVPQISLSLFFFFSPRNTTPYLPTAEGHRERVLSLSQALATEASQWHRMMTGEEGLGTLDSWVWGKRGFGEEGPRAWNPWFWSGGFWELLGSYVWMGRVP